jgi:hypothetical protein
MTALLFFYNRCMERISGICLDEGFVAIVIHTGLLL